MCYDRSSVGKKPMCATVCPSQALFFGTRAEVRALRPRSTPVNRFQFGDQTITTRVNVMVPRRASPSHVDVTAAMAEHPHGRGLRLPVVDTADPFAEVEV
jgi:Fe-S-cluster-containing dehydrogenase component